MEEKGPAITTSPFRYAQQLESRKRLAGEIIAHVSQDAKAQQWAQEMKHCGMFILLRQILETGEIKGSGFRSCRRHKTCPLCATRTGRKNALLIADKVRWLISEAIADHFQLVTLTIANTPDLGDGLRIIDHLRESVLKAIRNDKARGTFTTFFSHYKGGIYSIEITYNAKDDTWHPHIHFFCSGRGPVTEGYKKATAKNHPLSVELWERSGNAGYICDVRDIAASTEAELINAAFEVAKYCHDFKMPPEKVWEIMPYIAGKRMRGTFGCFRGIQFDSDPDDNLTTFEGVPHVDTLLSWLGDEYALYRQEQIEDLKTTLLKNVDLPAFLRR